MWFHCLLASWKSARCRGLRPQPARQNTRLTLEHLEDRKLPSSYSAANVSALIADITAANTAGGANTITLTAQTTSPYALTAKNNPTGLAASTAAGNGLPVIAANDNLTIVGNGDTIERTSVVANGVTSANFRLLDVAPLATLSLQNLTLQGGYNLYGDVDTHVGALGGAIYNQGALTLSGVSVANNQAYGVGEPGSGGAIWSNGSLTLENGTLLEANIARGGAAILEGSGGPDGLPSETFPAAAGLGGAVYVAGGTANITNTTFTGNSAIGGLGAAYGIPCGDAFGGALYVAAGQVILTTATVTNNSAFVPGYTTYVLPPATGYSGGGLYVAGGTVTIANDTVASNWAGYGTNNTPNVGTVVYSGYGGGLNVAGGTVTLTNDTVESNLAGYGGGIYIASAATVYLDSFTVANTINNTDSTGTNGSTANIDGTYSLQNP
jgi:hypothetical protein